MFGRVLAVALVAIVIWGVSARASSGAGAEQAYVVAPGDTLWTIAAERYGGDPREAIWRIRQRNGLEGTLLVPGRRLILPG